MDEKEILKTALYAGEIMISAGAETSRVEDTMGRILKAFGLKFTEAVVTPTMIMASIETETSGYITVLRRIKNRSYHFEKVVLVNDLSRDIGSGYYTIEEALKKLDEIALTPIYGFPIRLIACGIGCFAFSYISGGNLASCIMSFIISSLMYIVLEIMSLKTISPVLTNIVCGFFISFSSMFFVDIFSALTPDFNKVVIGCIMPLVPGVGITNAIRDLFEADYLSGGIRLMDSILIAVSIATGVGTGLHLWIKFFGGI